MRVLCWPVDELSIAAMTRGDPMFQYISAALRRRIP